MTKLPAFQFYPGDWLRDGVAGCSPAAQGLWLRMMIVGHDSERYGYLRMNGKPMPSEYIATRCGIAGLETYLTLLAELDAAGVPSRTPDGTIYSRRMVRDAQEREATRLRVKRHRKKCNGSGNGDVTVKYEGEDEDTELRSNEGPELPESLRTPEFEAAWKDWLEFRVKVKRKKVSARAAKMQLADLAKVGSAAAVECIRKSIANDYQGLFPDATKQPVRNYRISPCIKAEDVPI